ncbi:MAG: VOC family protein [Gammaproteobacteria bacterium]|nr:VOC family protein [Gammaproteobacteria bacterium]
MQLNRTTLLVDHLETAKRFYLTAFGFQCLLDEQQASGKRLIVVGPSIDGPGFLLSEPKPGDEGLVGTQSGQRVWAFIDTADLSIDLARFRASAVELVDGPREESFGTCLLVKDLSGNIWEWVQRR